MWHIKQITKSIIEKSLSFQVQKVWFKQCQPTKFNILTTIKHHGPSVQQVCSRSVRWYNPELVYDGSRATRSLRTWEVEWNFYNPTTQCISIISIPTAKWLMDRRFFLSLFLTWWRPRFSSLDSLDRRYPPPVVFFCCIFWFKEAEVAFVKQILTFDYTCVLGHVNLRNSYRLTIWQGLCFFLSWVAKTQLNHWTKRVMSTRPIP